MRRLTFKGYIESYITELSYAGTSSISKLVIELDDNPRLREPLALHAHLTKMPRGIEQKAPEFYAEYKHISERLGYEKRESSILLEEIGLLSDDYKKVVNSYMYERNRIERDNETKLLMRNRIIKLQEEKDISNYKIYKALGLNYGNMNYFLKNGSVEKLTLNTVREILKFVRNY